MQAPRRAAARHASAYKLSATHEYAAIALRLHLEVDSARAARHVSCHESRHRLRNIDRHSHLPYGTAFVAVLQFLQHRHKLQLASAAEPALLHLVGRGLRNEYYTYQLVGARQIESAEAVETLVQRWTTS